MSFKVTFGISAFCTSYDNHFPSITSSPFNPFLQNRHFLVKVTSAQHPLSPIHASVPQASVLSLLLYLIYTADLPTSSTTIATFADNTAVLASDSGPATASQQLQTHLNAIQSWLQKWHMQANTQITTHRNVPSCLHEQRATSLRKPCQIPRTTSGYKAHLAPPPAEHSHTSRPPTDIR
jgi:hypothetical protein